MRYAEVLLPLPLTNTFTYRIPEAMEDVMGLYCRVVAPFGKKHYYTGVVTDIHDRCPDQSYEVKELFALLDENPVIRDSQLTFWRWISSYYLCTLGEVYRAALPAGLKIVSETLKKGFKPKTETVLRLADPIRTVADLQNALALVKKAKQQEKLLLGFLELSGMASLDVPDFSVKSAQTVLKKDLLACSGVHAAVLNGLLQRSILVAEEKTVSRISRSETQDCETAVLSQPQQEAFEEIKKSFETKAITLLHDVSPGEKMDIYIRMIRETLVKGLQALYLLPEIALTNQVTERLQKVFGSQLLVYNSGLSDNERAEVWDRLLQSNNPIVVLGVRSSIFLPFTRLGLVLVDEEQEPSYKQQDPVPRYHARNAVMMLAHQHEAKTLLGSATPSLESYLWAEKGKYGYVKLDNRHGGSMLPTIEIVNVSELRRKKRMKDTFFSPLLKEKIDEALSKGEQAILFQNRRGFAPFVICRQCGEIPHCRHCDVSMTYHKLMHRLVCHYCGYTMPFPARCPSCNQEEMKMQGFGTEAIEEEVAALFPLAKTARLDFDTARTGSVYRRILSDFEAGKTQILIGTQMVAKGLEFVNVSVVGILNADGMMNIPDFRAYERAFQLMFQVAGCAVRRDRRGFVVIQTSQAGSRFLQMVRQFDYQGMAQTQLQERHQFHYPPYTRLILLILRSRNEPALDEIAELYTQKLKERLGSGVTGPVYPPVTRVQTLHVRKIMLKMELSVPVSTARKILEETRTKMQENPLFKQIIIHYDVDPQ